MVHRPRCARHVVPAARFNAGTSLRGEGPLLGSSSSSAPRSTLPGPGPAGRGRAAAALHPSRARVSWLRDPRQCPKPVYAFLSSPSGALGLRAIREPVGPRASFRPISRVSHHPQTSPPGWRRHRDASFQRRVTKPRPLDRGAARVRVGHQPCGPPPGAQRKRKNREKGTKQRTGIPEHQPSAGQSHCHRPSPAERHVSLCCRRQRRGHR